MKKKGVVILFNIFMIFSAAGLGYSETGKVAVAAKASSLGLGAELTAGITQTINGRIGFNAFEYDYDGTEGDVEYEFTLNLFSVSALLDWHPFDSGFRITGGALYNGNDVDAEGKPTNGSYKIGDETYTAEDVGTLTANFDVDDVAPYIGIGWGNAVSKDKRWSFVFDLGVIYQGSPEVTLSANGTLANDPTFSAELEKERRELEDDLDSYKYYPVIAFGVSYKF